MVLDEYVEVCHLARQLQVRIGDCTLGIDGRYQRRLYVRWEGFSPDEGTKGGICQQPGTPHARATGVGRAEGNREVRNNFAQACGPGAQIECEVVKIRKSVLHQSVKTDAVLVRLRETGLEGAEEAAPPGDGEYHAAQFAQRLVPVFGRYPPSLLQAFQNFQEAQAAVFGQFDGLCDSVDNPTQENFAHCPLCVSLRQFAEGDGF
jgi:hypothetical protein